MKELLIVRPKSVSDEMAHMIQVSTEQLDVEVTTQWSKNQIYKKRKILFCLDLDETGHCIDLIKFLNALKRADENMPLEDSSAAVFVRSGTDLYTKRAAQELLSQVNLMGCRLMGHSVVEVVKDLKNFLTWQKTLPKSLPEIRDDLCIKQVRRLLHFKEGLLSNHRILALHASSHATSNTLMLWEMIENHIKNSVVQTYHVENGSIVDCKGCDFRTCIHYAKQKSCFYGGQVVKEILPAIEESDIIVWICPNYNDALSANLTALINRLTVLYRRINFYNKRIYAVIVSGNSGSDSIANQLVGALNINKGFQLPPHFALMEIANDPGSILKVDGIQAKAKVFAEQINRELGNYE